MQVTHNGKAVTPFAVTDLKVFKPDGKTLVLTLSESGLAVVEGKDGKKTLESASFSAEGREDADPIKTLNALASEGATLSFTAVGPKEESVSGSGALVLRSRRVDRLHPAQGSSIYHLLGGQPLALAST